jgi:hypothetical protein
MDENLSPKQAKSKAKSKKKGSHSKSKSKSGSRYSSDAGDVTAKSKPRGRDKKRDSSSEPAKKDYASSKSSPTYKGKSPTKREKSW